MLRDLDKFIFYVFGIVVLLWVKWVLPNKPFRLVWEVLLENTTDSLISGKCYHFLKYVVSIFDQSSVRKTTNF